MCPFWAVFPVQGLPPPRELKLEPDRQRAIARVSRLLALAHHIQELIDTGQVKDLAEGTPPKQLRPRRLEVARRDHVTRARMTQIMTTAWERSEQTGREPNGRIRRTAPPQAGRNLLLLVPDIQGAILWLPRTTTGQDCVTERNVRRGSTEACFARQRQIWASLMRRR